MMSDRPADPCGQKGSGGFLLPLVSVLARWIQYLSLSQLLRLGSPKLKPWLNDGYVVGWLIVLSSVLACGGLGKPGAILSVW
jgi:hypothetical protein